MFKSISMLGCCRLTECHVNMYQMTVLPCPTLSHLSTRMLTGSFSYWWILFQWQSSNMVSDCFEGHAPAASSHYCKALIFCVPIISWISQDSCCLGENKGLWISLTVLLLLVVVSSSIRVNTSIICISSARKKHQT